MAITLTDPTISTFEEAKNPSEHPVEEPHDFDTVDMVISCILCFVSLGLFVSLRCVRSLNCCYDEESFKNEKRNKEYRK